MSPTPYGKEAKMRVRTGEIAETVQQGLSRSGRSAGARAGEFKVSLISGNNLIDDRIVIDGLEKIFIEHDWLTEKHILNPGDVVVTGKSTAVKAAVVPDNIGPAVANSTMLVLRTHRRGHGLYLWWLFTSTRGREMLQSTMVRSATLSSLSPRGLANLEVPLPSEFEITLLEELIRTSERTYWSAKEAADIRRATVRDFFVGRLLRYEAILTSEETNGINNE
jgi:hypothetical protein